MKNILFPTDFSSNATNAIYYGLQMFHDEPSRFFLFNSFYIPYATSDVPAHMSDVVAENAEKSFDDLLERIHSDFKGKDLSLETEFRVGEVAMTARSIAKRHKVDLIVMGTQGASGLEEVLIGTHTSMVIEHGVCPVLAIPEKSRFAPPKKILFAIDPENLELLDEAVLQPMVDMASKYKSQILLLYVAADDNENMERKVLGSLSDRLKGVEHAFHSIDDKKVPHGIEEFIKDNKVDMLAMVTIKLGLWDSIFHRSVTKKMAMHTTIPLLAMHAEKL